MLSGYYLNTYLDDFYELFPLLTRLLTFCIIITEARTACTTKLTPATTDDQPTSQLLNNTQ